MTIEAAIARLRPFFDRAERAQRAFNENPDDGLLTSFHDSWHALENAANAIRDRLDARTPGAAHEALAFLSIRARPFRSGYAFARLARALKRAPMDETQKAALRALLLDRLTWPWAHTPDLWRCYPAVRTTESDARIRELSRSSDSRVSRRAKRVLSNF